MSADARADTAAYAIDGRRVTQAAFYAAACDPRRSVVVEACAGAGKTWMLVSRIVRALLDGAQPHEILAITFTKKAAGEMRDRLSQWLAEFAAQGEAHCADALVQRGLDAGAARAAAPALAQLHASVLAGGRGVDVRTFHGWFFTLLRAAPHEMLDALGLHAGMQLIEDSGELQGAVWQRFLGAVVREPQWAEDLAAQVRLRGVSALERWRGTVLDKRIEIELADAAGTLESSLPSAADLSPDYAGLATPAARLRKPVVRAALVDLARRLGSGGALAVTAATALEAGLARTLDEQAFLDCWKALFTKDGEPRKKLGNDEGLDAARELLKSIRDARAQDEAHHEQARLVRLARVLLAAYAEVKRERGLADMPDLERVALHLLRDAPLAAWVHERLDVTVRHLLIDEFQDTSPLQWQALHAWLDGYAGAGGGASGQAPPSVFIVGDPKQSIYRFRRADPRVFQAAQSFLREALGAQVLSCDHTRRNAAAVIDAVNRVFTDAAGEFAGFRRHTTDRSAGAIDPPLRALPTTTRPTKDKAAATAQGNASAAADAWRDSLTTPRRLPEERLRRQEADWVAAGVVDLLDQGVEPGEIQVLSRKRATLALVAEALRERHVPHVAAGESELSDAPEARDLIALLDALVSPQHDLPLAQALKSPLFGASDDDLVAVALEVRARREAGQVAGWWQVLVDDPTAAAALHSRPALQRAAHWLPRWRQAAQALPPHDLLQRIVDEGELRQRLVAALPAAQRERALEHVDALMQASLALDGGRYATPYGFVRGFRTRRLPVPSRAHPDAVQLLTVHGAKGLEARAVFVVDCDPERTREEQHTLLVDWPVDATHPLRCAFVASTGACPPSLRALLAEERQAQAREELNGLYVAMTRAKELLVFSRTEPSQRASNAATPWWPRLQAVAPADWSPERARMRQRPEDGALASVPLLNPPVAGQAAHVELGRGAVRPENAGAVEADPSAQLGRAVHRALEWLTRLPVAERSAERIARATLAAAREFALPSADAVDTVTRRVLASPDLAEWLDPQRLAWAGNEVELAWQGETLRIDRLVARQREGRREWWVIDYKLHQAPQALAAYRAQLARYRDAVRAAQPGEPVFAAFVTGAGDWLPLPAGHD